MKLKQNLSVLFMVIGLSAICQSTDKWKLCVNTKKVSSGNTDVPGEALINANAKGNITIRYSGTGKDDSKRSIILFDGERHTLLRKEIGHSYGKFIFNLATLREKTQGQKFEIHTVAIPKDPETAALVKVRPVLLCVVGWKTQ